MFLKRNDTQYVDKAGESPFNNAEKSVMHYKGIKEVKLNNTHAT